MDALRRSTATWKIWGNSQGALDERAAVAGARGVSRWEDQDFVGQVSPTTVTDIGDPADGGPLVATVDLGLKSNINVLRVGV